MALAWFGAGISTAGYAAERTMRDYDDLLMKAYELREKMVADKFRPKYHFLPPQGRWNDLNGTIFWKGRYHIGYLQKIANGPNERDFSSWQHVSSRDRGQRSWSRQAVY